MCASALGSIAPVTQEERIEALLYEYATGAVRPATALLVETYAELRPGAGRPLIQVAEAAGGALLEQIEPAPMVSAPLPAGRPAGRSSQPLADRARSRALVEAARHDPNAFAWDRVAPGVHEARLPLAGAMLLRIGARRAIPTHSHAGEELTLVLYGAFEDENGRYQQGDIAFADADTMHRPAVTLDQDCVCLVSEAGPPRFVAPWMRVFSAWRGRGQ